MQRTVLTRAILFAFLLSVLVSNVSAVPLVLSHQGRLLDASDQPLSGTFTIIYSIYDAPVGGTQLWLEDHVGVVVTDGLFTVDLGSTMPLTAEIVAGNGGGGGGGVTRYLQVQISGQPPIIPRTPLLSAPSAVVSSNVFGETTGGTARARGIITKKPGGGGTTAGYMILLDADNDGDGIAENLASTEVDENSVVRRLESHNLGSSGQDGVELSFRCTPDSITETRTLSESGVARITFKAKEGATIARRVTTLVGPAGDSSETEEVCDTAGASLKMKVDGLMGPRMSTNLTVGKQSSSHLLTADLDGDGVLDNVCSSSSSDISSSMGVSSRFGSGPRQTVSMDGSFSSANTRCASDADGDGLDDASVTQSADDIESRLAIKTKGTSAGGRVNKVDAFTIKQGIAGTQTSTDEDGDGTDDQVITQTTSDTESRLAIKTKGTSAGGRVNKVDAFTIKQGIAGTQTSTDEDGDGTDDQIITQSTSDTESRLAIKTKGTSAGGRVNKIDAFTIKQGVAGIEGSSDEDGDGIPERRFQTLSNASKARHGCASDFDGDGLLDRISSLETDSMTAAMRVAADDDDDGIVDWSASVTADTADAQVLATGSGIEVAMKVKNKGVITGSIVVNNGNFRMVDFDSDGDGFVENSFGVGVDATHKIDVGGGAYCDGTNWVNASDRNSKENFETVDGGEILEKISDLEITKWNYKGDNDAQHIGPTAQDFKKTFGVGADDESISTIDPSGIALAAIKELYAQIQAKDKEMKELREEMAKLKKEMAKKK